LIYQPYWLSNCFERKALMACQPVNFTGITRDKFNAILGRIHAQAPDVTVTGDQGTASGEGFTVRWSYAEPHQTLIVQCMNKPWFVPEDSVNSKIRDLVEVD
jgi:hypothetical protein